MHIVIDINEETYKGIMLDKQLDPRQLSAYELKIANGIPLPKGHGRLIDADKISNKLTEYRDEWDAKCVVPTNDNLYEIGRCESYDFAVDEIKYAPTIIEAESEDK